MTRAHASLRRALFRNGMRAYSPRPCCLAWCAARGRPFHPSGLPRHPGMHCPMRIRSWPVLLALVTTLPGFALAKNDDKPRPDPAMVAARQKIFGTENVDARSGQVRSDKVIFSWITNASFAASVRGRVVLLDTFVTRLEVTAGRTPLVIQDLVDLKPEALFLGHGHFDHADNAAYISKKTGATIYASPETCDNMQLDAARIFGANTTVPCVEI